jgi:hypothetical protein
MSLGFADKRRTQGSKSLPVGTAANYASRQALETRLAAANGTYFTAARMGGMTENDLTYALRQIDDAAGIK